ncbi:hypothetical protein SULI_13540 [Saccharolobus solfataricus]|uniref:Uncharacterized protein n=1 Tax=Saccharolobus solfataricus TaxID=2287 RepID=A0A0E3GVS6_SACSO|nr:hypothetical protein [Saccharolobus solfataricus]AKA75144.1 hypothetical protein SULB_2659 [Saccharolobus solfataricus]AKA77836.1 hypothetical protein SULC_2656 [Saccharolobus solfataricus]AKA80532.1 hypothetical protein SULA_2658 [Saccharolobus solfataricus]AZF69582.1 hypothetical protein SULG_13540 [Saccharolobus solfataricus]AZF72202.1 hypothetical protein SULH_13540 [Saccharolobus solfataricus]
MPSKNYFAVISYGTDKYGNKRYGITIPAKLREKGKIYGKEVIVTVILPIMNRVIVPRKH